MSIILLEQGVRVDSGHRYTHPDVEQVYSVTQILKRGKSFSGETEAMKRGTEIHKALDLHIKCAKETLEFFNSLESEDQEKSKILSKGIDEYAGVEVFSEKPFIAKDGDLVFGGTPDFRTNEVVIDFKSGPVQSDDYRMQVGAYAKAYGLKKAILLGIKTTEEGFELDKRELGEEEIDIAYNDFKVRAFEFLQQGGHAIEPQGLITIEEKLSVYLANKAEIERLNANNKQIQEQLGEELVQNKLSKYENSNCSVYFTKESQRFSLKKEVNKQLQKKHPEFFDTITVKGSLIVRAIKPKEVGQVQEA